MLNLYSSILLTIISLASFCACSTETNTSNINISSNSKLQFYLSKNQSQKHIHTFDNSVLKATLNKDKTDLKKHESNCQVTQPKLVINTISTGIYQEEDNQSNPQNSGTDGADNNTGIVSNDSIAKTTPLLFEKWNEDYLVITIEGEISFYTQSDEKTLIRLSRMNTFTSAEQADQSILNVFTESGFIYFVIEKKEGYYLKTISAETLEDLKTIGEMNAVFENRVNGKIIYAQLKNGNLFLLNKYFVVFVVAIDSNTKIPKIARKVFIQSMSAPRSFMIHQDKVFMLDEEKGIYAFKLEQLLNTSNNNDQTSTQPSPSSSDLYIKGESVYAKIKMGKLILKLQNNTNYFLVLGKQNSRTYIAEISNTNSTNSSSSSGNSSLSTSDDQPEITGIQMNQHYIIFTSQDNLHVIYRGIPEDQIAPLEKQFTFESPGILGILLDPTDDNVIHSLTGSSINTWRISRRNATIACFYSENNQATQDDKTNVFSLSLISENCQDPQTNRVCVQSVAVNVSINQVVFSSDVEAFVIGFGFGAGILVLIGTVYYIKKKSSSSAAQKNYMQEKYNNFDNEGENEEDNNHNVQQADHSVNQNNTSQTQQRRQQQQQNQPYQQQPLYQLSQFQQQQQDQQQSLQHYGK